jgi:hypothetical protein
VAELDGYLQMLQGPVIHHKLPSHLAEELRRCEDVYAKVGWNVEDIRIARIKFKAIKKKINRWHSSSLTKTTRTYSSLCVA